jgi:uncharacterized damage-inducible protein DinB
MTPGITFAELMDWNEESATFWKAHLEANPALLELPCGIGGTPNVQEFLRHIWGVELRWAQRIAGVPVTERKDMPEAICRSLLQDPAQDWNETRTMDYDWLPPHARTASRRKLMGHMLFHSERHWAQLATLLRAAGFPAGFRGDFLFTQALA